MAAIDKWLTTPITIKRLTAIDGTHETYQTISTTVLAHIQEFEGSRKIVMNHTLFKSFRMYAPLATDIAEEDTVNDGTYTYTVKGVIRRVEGGNPHLEVQLERAETQADA
jgi:hypothetical protein